MTGISNQAIVKFIGENTNEDLKKTLLEYFLPTT